ncbi:WG repeat-containing protein [Mucilaginibacter psychrotolerans]|uniref:WG repeat-containing protein n=1 Tax=Mucilaginibacter psychrotolerans TaxID=1524096 RepID=A0A4Y8S658_9SPHI|nr:WG repeat-containing protein [Mucilaginibacter psychrotolerans]TFF34226.1 hypothetical protein E2R66_22845 [Mucilaginibacter psychrotolerans]
MKLLFFCIGFLLVNCCFAQSSQPIPAYPLKIPTAEYFARNFAYANDSIAPVGNNGHFQYLNIHTNKAVFNKVFEEAYPFSRGHALVKYANKYGVIDRNGEYAVQPKFVHFSFYTGIGTNTTVGFDTIATPGLTNMVYFDFDEGRLVEEIGGHMYEPIAGDIFDYEQAGKYGLIFKDGSKTLPIYDSILVRTQYMVLLKKGGKIGAISSGKKTIAPFVFTEAVIEHWDGYSGSIAYALKKQRHWYYFDSGKGLFKNKHRPVSTHYKFSIVKIGKGLNYVDEHGKLLLRKPYKWLSELGYMGINEKDEIVLFDKQRRGYGYYTP